MQILSLKILQHTSYLMIDTWCRGKSTNQALAKPTIFLSSPSVIREYCFDFIIRKLVDVSYRKHVEGFCYILLDPSKKN